AGCRKELEALRRAAAMVSELGETPAPADLWDRLEARLEQRGERSVRPVQPVRRLPAFVAAAVTAVLAVGISVRVLQPGGDPLPHVSPYVYSHLALNRTPASGGGTGVDAMVLLSARGERK
ncbi:MAG: hypothetical protein QHJ73_16185, partial [Armatimonadota bacterium]|nr:hypothetical protein [Armatimonadota bacterium]